MIRFEPVIALAQIFITQQIASLFGATGTVILLKNIFNQGSQTLVNIIFAVVLTLGLFVTASVYLKGNNIAENTQHLATEYISTYKLLNELNNYLIEQERFLNATLTLENSRDEKVTNQAVFQKPNKVIDTLVINLGDNPSLKIVVNNLKELNRVNSQLLGYIEKKDANKQLTAEYLNTISKIRIATKQELQSLIDFVDLKVGNSKNEILTGVSNVKLFVLLYGIATFIISYVIVKAIAIFKANNVDTQRLSLFPSRNPNPVFSLDHQNNVTYANPACGLLLKRLSLPVGQTHLLVDNNIKFYQDEIMADVDTQSTSFEYQINQLFFQCNLYSLEDRKEWDIHLTDITARKAVEKELSYRASHDPETGLKNRYELEKTVADLCQSSQEFSFGLLEIRSFSQLLTGQGLTAASTVMNEVADVIREIICGFNVLECSVYHLGEKSFALISKQNANKGQIYSLVREIEEKVSNTSFYCHYEVRLDYGFSCFPAHGNDYSSLHKSALAALDKSASSEDKRHIVFNPELGERLRYQQQLIEDMRLAISNANFELYFQPQLDLRTGKVTGAEVLIRWQRNAEWMSPAEFIPLAEKAGLIDILGDWILHTSCQKARNLVDLGLEDLVIAVNISPLQFGRKDFLAKVQHVLEDTGLPSKNLELEITEGVIIYNEQETIATLESLKKLGVKLAIDDFGTGYSSLSYLKKFNIDKLKIDQSFVRNIQHENADQSIVRTIIELGRNLSLTLIAEGVEEQEQLNILKSMGCDEIQGYFFSRPLPEQEFIEFVQQQRGSY
ncbi:bifunctional diguanylate cyclase/phosphodiesterase [Paraglaciecola sp.]|uniref:putative bifunctional diguanylate cyclase/phosphodiesterase n=1 Tax=Paraglaciecola sp. TaxID=1920173 RepID=UPI003264908C